MPEYAYPAILVLFVAVGVWAGWLVRDRRPVPPTLVQVELTPAQWAVLQSVDDVAHVDYRGLDQDGSISVLGTKDDSQVTCWIVKPDGSYTVDVLNGLGYGWNTLDEEGYEIEFDGEAQQYARVSDQPHEDWA